MKKQSGITLVALIITIIVMIILAGVVIVTALLDGGILDRTQTALRENERAEVEDIVMGSYVYKALASMNTIGQLDLEKTAQTIYNNLTGNGYTVKTSAGEEAQSYEEIFPEGATSISLNVEGKRGTYEGTVEKNGLKDGMKIVGDTGNEVPPVNDDNEDDGLVTIPTPSEEIDLSAVLYIYNSMYNSEQSDIHGDCREGDDNEDNIADKNANLYYYTCSDRIIPVTYFSQVIDENTSDIEAVITHFDGTKETIILNKENNYCWKYTFTSPSILGEMEEMIFSAYGTTRYGSGWRKNDDFHYLELGGGNAIPFKAISLLGGTIDFSFNCQAYVAMGDETLENIIPMYNDISNVSQVVINYSDGTNKSYSKEKIFDANSYYMDDFYFSSKEVPVLYMDGMFIINMPSSHIEKQITSVILVEDEVAKKYNVSNNTQVMAMSAAN